MRLHARITRRLFDWLSEPIPAYEQRVWNDPHALRRTIRKGDVVLVEGDNRISVVIKYLTQSSWSHAALYIGDELLRHGGELADRTRREFGADAEELAQEVFTAVFRSACGYGDRATPLSWIYGIARNTALNYVRRQQQERAREERWLRDGAIPPAPEWAYTPEERCREERLGEELERRIRSLADWQRDAFRLRHLEDASIEEISRKTARSADAVRSSLYRAKRMLFETAEIDEGGSDE